MGPRVFASTLLASLLLPTLFLSNTGCSSTASSSKGACDAASAESPVGVDASVEPTDITDTPDTKLEPVCQFPGSLQAYTVTRTFPVNGGTLPYDHDILIELRAPGAPSPWPESGAAYLEPKDLSIAPWGAAAPPVVTTFRSHQGPTWYLAGALASWESPSWNSTTSEHSLLLVVSVTPDGVLPLLLPDTDYELTMQVGAPTAQGAAYESFSLSFHVAAPKPPATEPCPWPTHEEFAVPASVHLSCADFYDDCQLGEACTPECSPHLATRAAYTFSAPPPGCVFFSGADIPWLYTYQLTSAFDASGQPYEFIQARFTTDPPQPVVAHIELPVESSDASSGLFVWSRYFERYQFPALRNTAMAEVHGQVCSE